MERLTNEKKGCLCGVNPKRLCEALERLREYEDTDLTPEEIHIMSEELAAYHELMLTPEEIKKLRSRMKIKPVERYKGTYLCPDCGWIVGFVDSGEIQMHCERCGQALVSNKGKYEVTEECGMRSKFCKMRTEKNET